PPALPANSPASTLPSRWMSNGGHLDPPTGENRMRIHAIALGALLAAGCSAPDNDAATPPPVAEDPAQASSTPPGAPPAIANDDESNIVPMRFQGDYAADTPACSTPAHESRLAIGAWRIKF